MTPADLVKRAEALLHIKDPSPRRERVKAAIRLGLQGQETMLGGIWGQGSGAFSAAVEMVTWRLAREPEFLFASLATDLDRQYAALLRVVAELDRVEGGRS